MPKVSILVAVYNAEPFLHQCLDSLRNQTLWDIQVICVDDGSTDGSLRLLREYALKDYRIEVIALPNNSGLAHARNEGLKHATGDYVCMLDADDWFSDDALQLAVEAFDELTDIVLFDVVMWNSPQLQKHYSMPFFEYLSGDEAFQLSLSWKIHGLYMVRASIHHKYPYDETCQLYSDENTTHIHYLFSRKVRCCVGIYYYRQHAASAIHCISARRFDYLRANESLCHQMRELNVSRKIVDDYENNRWLNLIDVYMFYHVHGHELTPADRAYGLKEIRRVWHSIDRQALKKETTAKFGYRPCKYWPLFRLQEWLYFTLRGFFGRNR